MFLVKVFLIAIVLAVAWLTATAQTISPPALSVADKAAIIQSAMEMKLDRDGPAQFAEFLVFSTYNMSPALLPKIPGFRFTLMNENLIQKKARRRMSFRWLRIGEFSLDRDVVTFKLAIIERRGGLPYHSHLYQYAFTKSGDQWHGKLVLIIC